MIFVWNTTICLLEGCIISLFLFLIASVFIPDLKKIRPHYLRYANISFATLGFVMLGLSVFLFFLMIQLAKIDFGEEYPARRNYSAEIILMMLLLLGIVPVLAFSRKRNTTVWFTCLLLFSISMIVHIIEVMQWILNITGIDPHYYPTKYGPDANWYRIAAAVLIFVIPYWFARRKISRG